ncbi:MAG: Cytochrome oxidase maturation protein cbb3-type [Methanolobus sp. T82-4]|nr:MAG: Cytochrome oxidase maturation protein cbb3-type [Methanolobus sp. T82-4]
MDEYALSLFIFSICLFLIFLGFFIWGWKSGQFEDIEEAKYRMLETPDIPKNERSNNKNNYKGE